MTSYIHRYIHPCLLACDLLVSADGDQGDGAVSWLGSEQQAVDYTVWEGSSSGRKLELTSNVHKYRKLKSRKESEAHSP